MKKKLLSIILTLCLILGTLGTLSLPSSAAETIHIGDYLQMGTYYDVPILWRCVDIDENGPLMLSDKILCLKAFDASGTNTSGSHGRGYYYNGIQGYYRQQHGSNYWGDSNIRDWLNSDASAGNVVWSCGNPPYNENVWEGYNDYAFEAGFLTNFSQRERVAMKTVTQKSLLDGYEHSFYYNTIYPNYHPYNSSISDVLQNYDTAFSEQVTDTVFLLDVKQINRVYQNDALLGGNNYYIGYPTVECVENSEYISSSLTSTQRWGTFLRSPYAADGGHYGYGHSVRRVDSVGGINYGLTSRGDGGIRPAFYLNLASCEFSSGNGSAENPYMVGDVAGAPTEEPTTPTLSVSNAYPAADGSNAIYYVIDIVNHAGSTLETLTVSHCPEGVKERYADTREYELNLSGNLTVRFISLLRGIPEAQKERIINTWVDLDYRDENGTHTLSEERSASLSGARGY